MIRRQEVHQCEKIGLRQHRQHFGGNLASGFQALFFNSTGRANTANGVNALQNNTTGSNNTASSTGALFNNTTGDGNTAVGLQAGIIRKP